MDKKEIKNALEIINDAIFDLNDGDTNSEDYYWWRAVLNIFNLDVENGEIILAKYPKGSFLDNNRFFKEWD